MKFFKKIRAVFLKKEKVDDVESSKKTSNKKAVAPQQRAVIVEEQVSEVDTDPIKVVITGSVGAGKTTAIHAVSEKAPVTTETTPSDEIKKLKSTTTTTMDYGSYIHLGKKIHVYGTPGQKRFGFMSGVLTVGARALIILITNNQDKPLEELAYYLENNQEFLLKNPAIIGVTHLDVNKKHKISIYTEYMESQSIKWLVVPIDARKKKDVLKIIDQVIKIALKPKIH